MKQSIEEALPFAEAFSSLLYPFAEVVLHDLQQDKIVAIYNPLSKRNVGDSSYLDRISFKKKERVIGPYEKTNWDGRPLKSISIVLYNSRQQAEGFLCINMDVSIFEKAHHTLQLFLKNTASFDESSQRLFKDDLYEKINVYVQSTCKEKQLTVEMLSRKDKQTMILDLQNMGAFEGKHAASYVGRILDISRATVYNYLKGGVD